MHIIIIIIISSSRITDTVTKLTAQVGLLTIARTVATLFRDITTESSRLLAAAVSAVLQPT